MKKIVLSLATATLLSGVAVAGGDIVPVAPGPADSWSGFYVGLQAGGIWGDADVDYSDDEAHTYGLDVDGFMGGIFGGYNWQLIDNWLVGVEGEWNYVNADDTGVVLDGLGQDTGWKTYVEQDWDASLRLRVGRVMGDYLPYVTGGVAWGHFEVKTYDGNNPGDSGSMSMTLTGWTLGAGVEMRLSENLHARLQYRYTDYGDDTKTIYPPDLTAKLDYNAHMVTLGISYRF